MSHVAVWQRIADLLLANGQPLSTVEIAERTGLTVNHVGGVLNRYTHVFECLSGGSHRIESVWSTFQLEAARLRVLYGLYGEKPVVRGIKDVRAMVRRAG